MDARQTQLRDRMLRDAIVEVLRASFDASGRGDAILLIDAGLVGAVIVTGDRVRVDLVLPTRWSAHTDALAAEVRRRIDALPEVTRTEVCLRRSPRSAAAPTTSQPQATAPRRNP
jgi:hypothetical protein